MIRTKAVPFAAAAAVTGLVIAFAPGNPALAAQPVAVSVKVPNGTFEAKPAWKASRSGAVVTTSTSAHSGKKAGLLYASTAGGASMTPTTPLVAKTVKGTTYTATIWVSGNKHGDVPAFVTLNEISSGRVVAHKTVKLTARSSVYTKVSLALVSTKSGSQLNITVGATTLKRTQGLRVDDLSLTALAPAPAPKPPVTPTPSTTTTAPAPSPTTTAPAPSTTTTAPAPSTTTTAPAPSTTTAPPTVPAPSTSTVFGTTAQPRNGTLADAVDRQDAKFGHLAVLRYYAPGLPPAWSQITALGQRDLAVSFKDTPTKVTSGADDAYLLNWFATAPRDRNIWWTYFHEPENDVASGAFTPAQYKAAFAHVSDLAKQAGRTDLKSTMILMGYTVTKSSGRNWLDYYPGADKVDVLGWDVYNHSAAQQNGYGTPENVFGKVVEVSKAAGKPLAIGETGAPLQTGDDGTGRAAYLKAAGDYLKAAGAAYVTYYDSTQGGAYTLDDSPSINAWGSFM